MPRFNRMVVNGAISDRNIFRHSVFVQVKCLQATNTKKYLLLKPHRLPYNTVFCGSHLPLKGSHIVLESTYLHFFFREASIFTASEKESAFILPFDIALLTCELSTFIISAYCWIVNNIKNTSFVYYITKKSVTQYHTRKSPRGNPQRLVFPHG